MDIEIRTLKNGSRIVYSSSHFVYKNNLVFSIVSKTINKNGQVEKEYPIMSFGKTKAIALLMFVDEIAKFVGVSKGENNDREDEET